MKGRGWIALGLMVLAVFVLVLLRGNGNANGSPNHASASDAPDGTSALRLYADALGHSSGLVEGDFTLPSTAGLLFIFTPGPFTADEVQQVNAWVTSGGVLVYAAETGCDRDPLLDPSGPARLHATRARERLQRSPDERVLGEPFDRQRVRRLDLDPIRKRDPLEHRRHLVQAVGPPRADDEREVDLGVRGSRAHASSDASRSSSAGSRASALTSGDFPSSARAAPRT